MGGNLIGEDAVGAIGVSFPVIFTLIGLSMGISMASTILIAQYYGAKNYRMVERVVGNSFSVALLAGVILSVSGMLLSDFLLRLMDTPPENFAMASSYLKISLAGFILLYVGFLINSILRGIGDAVTPLAFMSIGIGINAVIDPFFYRRIRAFPQSRIEWGSICEHRVTDYRCGCQHFLP
jgi:Na+-driven multidrug efflux pump